MNFTNWHGFDFVKKSSNLLLVTIGESWTWGDSLQSNWANRIDDKEFRLANVYGGQLSSKLNSDFLNIAIPGESNLWIANKLDYLIDNIDSLNYKNIIIILTLTEVGREFNGNLDNDIDYVEELKSIKSFDDFLKMLSYKIAEKIKKHLPKNKILIGTNFVDSNYPVDFPILNKTWVDLIFEYAQIPMNSSNCFTVLSWVFERFNDIKNFAPSLYNNNFKQEIIECMDKANLRTQLLLNSPVNYRKASKHPTPEGHALWSDYLYSQIVTNGYISR